MEAVATRAHVFGNYSLKSIVGSVRARGEQCRRKLNRYSRHTAKSGPATSPTSQPRTASSWVIAAINARGDTFLESGKELVARNPILRLVLGPPGDLAQIARMPALANIRVLHLVPGHWINDDGIEHLVRSPYLLELRTLNVAHGALSERGIRTLASLRLPHLVYINVSENPGAELARLRSTVINGGRYILTSEGERLWGEALGEMTLGYSGRAEWPPQEKTFLFDSDE